MSRPKIGLELRDYATLKELPINFLQSEGLVDNDYFGSPAVQIPYLDELGNEIAVRFRGSLDGENRFWWKPQTTPAPYGLWHLEQARERGFVVLVEGESDCHTLWFHNIPALGVPGAQMWRNEWVHHLDGIPEIYVVIEPDVGGEALMKKLAESGIQDRIRMIQLGPHKDPSGLYKKNTQNFQESFERAIANAVPCITTIAEANNQEATSSLMEYIDEGSRNSDLFKLACRLRRAALSGEEIKETLLAVNSNRCRPPLLESEVAAIVKSASKYPEGYSQADTCQEGFQLTPLRDLLAEPEETARWVWEEILPQSGVSILAAKPKVGKSTFARNLAMAVARGNPFLGRNSAQGAVVYLALEEIRSWVKLHFKQMGASDDPIHVHVGPSQVDGLTSLRRAIETTGAVLAIVDPMLRFIRVKDGNDYAEMTTKLEPVISLARETRCHIIMVHHTTKGRRGWDAILGSQAIIGAVDAAIMLEEGSGGKRKWMTKQRYGESTPSSSLDFDRDTGIFSSDHIDNKLEAPTTVEPAEKNKKIEILEFLDNPNLLGEQLEEQILAGVRGDTGQKKKSLRALVTESRVIRTGKGVKGDPYHYNRKC